MYLFQVRPFWVDMHTPYSKLKSRFELFFGKEPKRIEDRGEAINILLNITSTIQEEMLERIKCESTYGLLCKLYYIFNEVHLQYLIEKETRLKLVEYNIDQSEIIEEFANNRDIAREIIDASNIWIENCVLYQHDLNINDFNAKKEFVMDYDLLIDLYLYGFASRGVSLLTLSKKIRSDNSFYGLEITGDIEEPAKILKYHPYIYYNPVILGNQNGLVKTSLTPDANDTVFGKGFKKEYDVDFLLFLAEIRSFQEDQLRKDKKSLAIISKENFIKLVEFYTKPRVNGEAFYNSFVLTKNKIKSHLRNDEELIWIIGANKYRHELRPFVGLDDGNVVISYGALEQATQLWVSYFSNGGMCYTMPDALDDMRKAMELRNKELSDILIEKIRAILNKHYNATVDLKDVKYDRIFGERSINYGDYDIVYYSEDSKELFLIESKYFSDSLNSSGMVTDYQKMFQSGGYYEHCRQRYDLVLAEPEKMKAFIDTTDTIFVHMLFLSSKPIEMELQDRDKVVTMLSLNVFEKYIEGNLISGEDDSVIRPVHIL